MVAFRNRPIEIDAFIHDGTDACAKDITKWINDGGGVAQAYLKGSVDVDPDNAYIVVRGVDQGHDFVVSPDWWVYRYQDGNVFFTCDSDQFNRMFVATATFRNLVGRTA